ncbi:MAG: hypothetical protein HC887_04220 [Desulfobacteraceae bacterium]|nr:hypothetical protein [Desulfobacteraceae bacterium]
MITSALATIERESEKLSLQEQLKLLESLVRQIRKKSSPVKKQTDWKELYGIGSGIWDGEDAQDYVNKLREER